MPFTYSLDPTPRTPIARLQKLSADRLDRDVEEARKWFDEQWQLADTDEEKARIEAEYSKARSTAEERHDLRPKVYRHEVLGQRILDVMGNDITKQVLNPYPCPPEGYQSPNRDLPWCQRHDNLSSARRWIERHRAEIDHGKPPIATGPTE